MDSMAALPVARSRHDAAGFLSIGGQARGRGFVVGLGSKTRWPWYVLSLAAPVGWKRATTSR